MSLPTRQFIPLPRHLAWRLRTVSFRSFTAASRLKSTVESDHVRIIEVGARDGLQNEKNIVPLATKIELIQRLAGTGVRDIEAGSFVSPKWVPQMANTSEIFEHILRGAPRAPHPIAYNYLVPNVKGMENMIKILQSRPSPAQAVAAIDPGSESAPITSAQDANSMPTASSKDPRKTISKEEPSSVNSSFTSEISIFAAATETFSKTNINCSIAESLERFRPIVALAKEHDIRVRGYVSVALGCPYEGPNVDPHKVAEITASLLEMGADEVSVADTTGMGTAPRTQELLRTLTAAGISNNDIALHFHDTYGQALVNTVVGLEHGIRIFDSSVGGLGGCPYSKGATGNVATEDLVHTLHSLGMSTGVDLEDMAEIGAWISRELGRQNGSRAGKAVLARKDS